MRISCWHREPINTKEVVDDELIDHHATLRNICFSTLHNLVPKFPVSAGFNCDIKKVICIEEMVNFKCSPSQTHVNSHKFTCRQPVGFFFFFFLKGGGWSETLIPFILSQWGGVYGLFIKSPCKSSSSITSQVSEHIRNRKLQTPFVSIYIGLLSK